MFKILIFLFVLQTSFVWSYAIRKNSLNDQQSEELLDKSVRSEFLNYLKSYGIQVSALEKFELERVSLRDQLKKELESVRWPSYYEFISLRPRHPESKLWPHPFLTNTEILTIFSDYLHEFYFYKVRFSTSESKIRLSLVAAVQQLMRKLAQMNLRVLVKNTRTGQGISSDVVESKTFLELLALEIIVQRKVARLNSLLESLKTWEEESEVPFTLYGNKEPWKMAAPKFTKQHRDVILWVQEEKFVFDSQVQIAPKMWSLFDQYFLPLRLPQNEKQFQAHVDSNPEWKSSLEDSRKLIFKQLQRKQEWNQKERKYLELILDSSVKAKEYLNSLEPILRVEFVKELKNLGLDFKGFSSLSKEWTQLKGEDFAFENLDFVKLSGVRQDVLSNPGMLRSTSLGNLELSKLFANYLKGFISYQIYKKNSDFLKLLDQVSSYLIASDEVTKQLEEQGLEWVEEESKEDFVKRASLSLIVEWRVAHFFEFLESLDRVIEENFHNSIAVQDRIQALGENFYLSLQLKERQQLRQDLLFAARVHYNKKVYELRLEPTEELRLSVNQKVLNLGIPDSLMDFSIHLDKLPHFKAALKTHRK